MKKVVLVLFSVVLFGFVVNSQESKLVSKNGHIKFYSHTSVEDIEANNYKVVSSVDKSSGEVVFSVPMQSFEFEKSLMQKHYNSSKFLDTKTFPKAKFKGKITNLSEIDFTKKGTYKAKVEGEMTIKGKTNQVSEMGTITVADGKVTVNSKMNITLSDYGIEFVKGKPSSNIAKTLEITIKAVYSN